MDLAFLSTTEEAALATKGIKDPPAGLKLQNLALATITGPALSRYPKKMSADVQDALEKCESLGPGKRLILHGKHRQLQGVSRLCQSFDVISCRVCSFSAV